MKKPNLVGFHKSVGKQIFGGTKPDEIPDFFRFEVDKKSGLLSSTDFRIEIPYPVCVKFLKK